MEKAEDSYKITDSAFFIKKRDDIEEHKDGGSVFSAEKYNSCVKECQSDLHRVRFMTEFQTREF